MLGHRERLGESLGPLDPPDDRDPQVLRRGPGAAVEDVSLLQRKERLHGSFVACAPTRPTEPTMLWRLSAWTNFRL